MSRTHRFGNQTRPLSPLPNSMRPLGENPHILKTNELHSGLQQLVQLG